MRELLLGQCASDHAGFIYTTRVLQRHSCKLLSDLTPEDLGHLILLVDLFVVLYQKEYLHHVTAAVPMISV